MRYYVSFQTSTLITPVATTNYSLENLKGNQHQTKTKSSTLEQSTYELYQHKEKIENKSLDKDYVNNSWKN